MWLVWSEDKHVVFHIEPCKLANRSNIIVYVQILRQLMTVIITFTRAETNVATICFFPMFLPIPIQIVKHPKRNLHDLLPSASHENVDQRGQYGIHSGPDEYEFKVISHLPILDLFSTNYSTSVTLNTHTFATYYCTTVSVCI